MKLLTSLILLSMFPLMAMDKLNIKRRRVEGEHSSERALSEASKKVLEKLESADEQDRPALAQALAMAREEIQRQVLIALITKVKVAKKMGDLLQEECVEAEEALSVTQQEKKMLAEQSAKVQKYLGTLRREAQRSKYASLPIQQTGSFADVKQLSATLSQLEVENETMRGEYEVLLKRVKKVDKKRKKIKYEIRSAREQRKEAERVNEGFKGASIGYKELSEKVAALEKKNQRLQAKIERIRSQALAESGEDDESGSLSTTPEIDQDDQMIVDIAVDSDGH
jgi:hypothetical protein